MLRHVLGADESAVQRIVLRPSTPSPPMKTKICANLCGPSKAGQSLPDTKTGNPNDKPLLRRRLHRLWPTLRSATGSPAPTHRLARRRNNSVGHPVKTEQLGRTVVSRLETLLNLCQTVLRLAQSIQRTNRNRENVSYHPGCLDTPAESLMKVAWNLLGVSSPNK
jgi:hypothetical protein